MKIQHTYVCAAVFSGLTLVGSYQIIAAVMNPAGLDFPRGTQAFREGLMTQAIEKQIDVKLPLRPTLIAFANTVRYQLLGGGGDQVRTGKNDWLFLADELKYEGPKANADSSQTTAFALKTRINLIAELSKRLDAQGVKLVVALVPDKARLYAQHLNLGVYPPYNQERYANAIAALNANNVTSVNLLAPMASSAQSTQIYYRTDTHWNQTGAAIAAKQIASVVNGLKLDLKQTNFSTVSDGKNEERAGDLIRLMGLEFVPNSLRPKPDQEVKEVTRQSDPATSATQSTSSGLFDDAGVPVVLVGTSYSLRANFHGRLQEFLVTKVLNSAKDGGGFLQAMTAYLKDDAFKTAKPQVLVWEIPERMLQSPIGDEAGWMKKVFSTSAKP
jgi:alginate O-acetyltransferase complex protein AlgJ